MKIIKKFESKKNKVLLVQSPDGSLFVKKIFANSQSCRNELQSLLALDGNCAPMVLGGGENFIDMEYIEGCLFLDAFLSADTEQMSSLAQSLWGFFKDYARTFKGYVPADVNFRNFILRQGKCYGVDFEEKIQGSLALCVAKAAAFALLYDTDENKKKAFCHALISLAGFSPYQLKAMVDKEVNFLILRRNNR